MASFNNEIVLLASVASAGAGNWYPLDWRAPEDKKRTFQGNMNASDSISLQIADSTQTYITTVSNYTGAATFNGVLTANAPYVRVVKTGTNAAATVILWG